ncbi:MAG: D-alanyl-D-alanine carboxypeptidase, partial [Allosphingosinicella sp.]
MPPPAPPRKFHRLRILTLAFALAAAPAAAEAPAPLQQRVEALLQQAGTGTRFGLVVTDEEGREIVSIAPEGRFIPASNTKLFTTAAALALLPVEGPDESGGAAVRLERVGSAPPDVILVGHGDARLSSRPDCVADCLAVLADAVAAATRVVSDVVGDDSLFPDERWSPGMSWNNIDTRSGTAASALSLDDNELHLRIVPSEPGQAPAVEGLPYYRIDNRALTTAGGAASFGARRLPGSDVVRPSGKVPVAAGFQSGVREPLRCGTKSTPPAPGGACDASPSSARTSG